MTDPKYARDTDKGRYYTHPLTGQQLVSVTNVLSVGFTKFGLPRWYANNAADYALDNLPRVVATSRTDRAGIRTEIAEAAERVRDSAAHLGSRIHHLADAHVTGQQVAEEDGDREAGLYVAQYLRFINDFDVDLGRDIVAAEMTVADPGRGYAGTLDLIVMLPVGVEWTVNKKGEYVPKGYRLPDGQRHPWLLDTKTSRTRAATMTYPDNRLQLAALRGARECWLPDDSVEPMLSVSTCAVLNLRAKAYELIPMPCMTPDLHAFYAILDACKWLHGSWPGEYSHRPITPKGTFKPKRNAKKADAEPVATQGDAA